LKLTDVSEWMQSGKYLPECLRDFHDQKDIFKAIHQTIKVDGNEYCKGISFVAGQCYVIDIFLWYMAKRGYTLQKTRRKGEGFRDLREDVKAETERRQSAAISVLKQAMGKAI